jgi:hypothetical protein
MVTDCVIQNQEAIIKSSHVLYRKIWILRIKRFNISITKPRIIEGINCHINTGILPVKGGTLSPLNTPDKEKRCSPLESLCQQGCCSLLLDDPECNRQVFNTFRTTGIHCKNFSSYRCGSDFEWGSPVERQDIAARSATPGRVGKPCRCDTLFHP